MIRAKVYLSQWGDLWFVDVADGAELLAGGSFHSWDEAMRWANAEVKKGRKAAGWKKLADDLSETFARLNLGFKEGLDGITTRTQTDTR